MTAEFNLSEHRQLFHLEPYFYCEDKVQEFIRLVKSNVLCYNQSKSLMLKELDKLAGEKLK